MRSPLRSTSPIVVAGLLAGSVLSACAGTSGATPSDATGPASPGSSDASGLTPPPGGVEDGPLTVHALNIQFEPAEIHGAAGKVLVLTLDNQDSGVPHNLQVTGLGNTDIIAGPARAQLQVGPLEPGSYAFLCQVHPNMTGTLIVDP